MTSSELLAACDKYGMYVMDEYADVWTSTKVAYDYGMHMAEWWEHDIANLVRKDKNHPCVIMYSIGNEIPEVGNSIDSGWGKKIADRIRELDPTRYVTNSMNLLLAGMDMLAQMAAGAQNQPEGTEHPNRILVGSETNPPDLDKNWEAVEKLSYVIGDFDWTAWDYLGENGIGGYGYGDAPANPKSNFRFAGVFNSWQFSVMRHRHFLKL